MRAMMGMGCMRAYACYDGDGPDGSHGQGCTSVMELSLIPCPQVLNLADLPKLSTAAIRARSYPILAMRCPMWVRSCPNRAKPCHHQDLSSTYTK